MAYGFAQKFWPNPVLHSDAAKSAASVSLGVIAPREAWRILQGESPCWGRASHPPVSSLASVAEPRERRSVDRESWCDLRNEELTTLIL